MLGSQCRGPSHATGHPISSGLFGLGTHLRHRPVRSPFVLGVQKQVCCRAAKTRQQMRATQGPVSGSFFGRFVEKLCHWGKRSNDLLGWPPVRGDTTMSDTPLTKREKVSALTFALVATAILIELGFRLVGPTYSGFNNESAEYPTNPRGYFQELRVENGRPIYGVPMNKKVGLGGRTGTQNDTPLPSRILGMGDSQGQGQGVYFADTMYEQLGALLQERGIPSQIRNVAVSGYDLDEIAARYAYEARDNQHFDLVLYTMVLDDFGLDRNAIAGSDFIAQRSNTPFDAWRARSATWNFVAHILEQWELSERTSAAYRKSFQGENLKKRTEQLRRLADQVRSDGSQFVVIVMPLLYDFAHYPFNEIHRTMNDLGQAENIHVLDILPILQPFQASDLWVHAIDHHPNEVAHKHIATAIDAYLLKHGLIKSSPD